MINIHLPNSIFSQISQGNFQSQQVPNGFTKNSYQGNGINLTNQKKANTLQAEINQIDREIDQLVYELYGFTEKEIRILEGGGLS